MIQANLSEPLFFDHKMSVNVSYGHYYSTFPNHWHSFIEIISPLAKDYTLTIGTESFTMTQNHFALVPPRTLHSIDSKSNDSNLIIQFSNVFLSQLHDFAANRNIFFLQPVLNLQDFLSSGENPLQLLIEIKDIFYGESAFKELHMYETLLHFFILIGTHNRLIQSSISAQKTPRQKENDKKFEAISEYLKANCTSDIALEDAAFFAGFSKYHFSRIFKEHYQMSFPEYITSLRIAKAAELLENPNLSIMDAALQSGFSNISTFNRAFRQINQCTPSQFRKMFDHSSIV